MGVGIARLAGQDFVADDDDASGFGHAVFSLLEILEPSKVEFAAAHEKVTFRVGADELAFLIEQFRIANGTEVPPVFLGFVGDGRRFRQMAWFICH